MGSNASHYKNFPPVTHPVTSRTGGFNFFLVTCPLVVSVGVIFVFYLERQGISQFLV